MKKWIVPSSTKDGALSLIAAHNRPGDAICEAPESFTNEMEPFFRIKEIRSPAGHAEYSVSIDQKYFDWLKSRSEEIKRKGEVQHLGLVHSVKKHKRNVFHNQLNPAQRFVYSILGPLTHEAQNPILKKIIGVIFSKKLDLYDKPF